MAHLDRWLPREAGLFLGGAFCARAGRATELRQLRDRPDRVLSGVHAQAEGEATAEAPWIPARRVIGHGDGRWGV